MNQKIYWVLGTGVLSVLLTLAMVSRPTLGEPPVLQQIKAKRWQIQISENSYGNDTHPTKNTILLDSETGDTWVMVTTDKANNKFQWSRLQKF